MGQPISGFVAGAGLLDQQLVQDWASLQRGECVVVLSPGPFQYAAYVDDRTEDGQLIWAIEEGTGCRRLFLRGDPVAFYLSGAHGDVVPQDNQSVQQEVPLHA